MFSSGGKLHGNLLCIFFSDSKYKMTNEEKYMKYRQLFLIFTVFSFFVLSSGSAQAALLYNVQEGQLIGVNNVDINGTNYDVAFRDGVFQDFFNLAEPFTFTGAEANMASLALANLMKDVPEGAFDSDPLLTYGCSGDNCQIRTPYEFSFGFVSATWFRNAALDVDDERGSLDFLPTYDSTGNAVVFADWSVSSPVPVPPSLLLFLSGVISMTFLGRRKKRA